jgi:hypothetical protein
MESWKTIDAFQAFHNSMEGLDQQVKIKQTLKCNLFLMIAQRALIKHLKFFMDEGPLVSCYICRSPNWSHRCQVPVTAQYHGLTNEMKLFRPPIHDNRQIGLKKFATSIAKQCKILITLRAGPHVFPQRFPIQHLANLVRGMWDNDAPLVLGWLKQNYLVDYAALPSNTHLAESNVKDANLCLAVNFFDHPMSNSQKFE